MVGVVGRWDTDTLLPNQAGYWSIITWQYDGWSTSGGYYSGETYDISGEVVWNDTTWTYFSGEAGEGLMRSDSGKVYCRGLWEALQIPGAPSDTSEKLLYNFTMEIGDTAYYDQSSVIVEGIGTSDILGISKKAWFLSNNDTIVQGLGSTMGLFRPWRSLFEANNWICSFYGYYKDTSGTVTNLSFTTEACVLDVNEDDQKTVTSTFGNDKIWITTEKPKLLQIYSYDGKLIYETMIASGETIVEINSLQSGFYILRLDSNYSEKFIKT